jgi:hypothetical protein
VRRSLPHGEQSLHKDKVTRAIASPRREFSQLQATCIASSHYNDARLRKEREISHSDRARSYAVARLCLRLSLKTLAPQQTSLPNPRTELLFPPPPTPKNPLYLTTSPNKPPTIHTTQIHLNHRRDPHHGQLKPPRKAVEQPEAQAAAMRASGEKRDPSTTAARLSRGPNSKCDGTSIPQDTRRSRHLPGVNPAEEPWPFSGDPAAGLARLAGEGVK